MTKQQQFFYDNAGYSVAPGETTEQGRERCAIALATAETWAVENGYEWYEGQDVNADLSWMDEDERDEAEVIYILLMDENAHVVQSLHGITNPTNAYRRVVRAELALEAMA